MKIQVLVKMLLLLPLIVFVDYVIMIFLGFTSGMLGFGDSFFCGTYCYIGKGVMLLSAVLFIFLLLRDIKQILIHKKNVEAS